MVVLDLRHSRSTVVLGPTTGPRGEEGISPISPSVPSPVPPSSAPPVGALFPGGSAVPSLRSLAGLPASKAVALGHLAALNHR